MSGQRRVVVLGCALVVLSVGATGCESPFPAATNARVLSDEAVVRLRVDPEGSAAFEGVELDDEGALTAAIGTALEIVVVPIRGYAFASWADETVANPRTIVIESGSELDLVARTQRTTHSVAIDCEGSGTVRRPDGDGIPQAAPYGEALDVIADPAVGHAFSEWSDGNREAQRTIVVEADVAITATFVPINYSVTFSADEGGTVTYVSDGDPERVRYGDRLTVTAHPEAGYTFLGYTGDRVAGDLTLTVQVTADTALHAGFARDVATLTLVSGEGGSVSLTDDEGSDRNGRPVATGARLTCLATAAPGWRFDGWENLPQVGTNPGTAIVEETKTARARFVALGYAVFAEGRDGGVAIARSSSVDGSFRYGDTTTVTAVADEGYRFAGWEGRADTANPLSETCSGDAMYTALFERVDFAVVVSAGTGGSVSGVESGVYRLGDTLNVVAEPRVGYRFVDWSDGAVDAGRTIVVAGDVSMTARFAAIEYAVTLTSDEGGTIGYVSDGDPMHIRYGDRLTVSAHPDAGYTFLGYTGDRSSSDRTLIVQVTADLVLHAGFARDAATLVLVATEGGSVSLTDEGGSDRNGRPVATGTRLTCAATAAPGWRFDGWENLSDVGTNPGTTTVTETKTARARFFALGYAVFADAGPGGRAVARSSSADGSFRYGDTITVTATPDAGYRFVGWEGSTTTANPLEETCTGEASYVALFEREEFTVVLTAQSGGTVSGDQSGVYRIGDTVTVSARPDAGHRFTGWTDGTVEIERRVVVDDDVFLTARFEAIEYTVTFTSDDGGSITYVSDGDPARIHYGDKLTVTAHPDAGYTFAGYTGDRVASAATFDLQVTGDTAIHAGFARDVVTLTLLAGQGGSVSLTDQAGEERNGSPVAAGTRLTCLATAAPGWRFDGWENLPDLFTNPGTTTVEETKSARARFVALGYAVYAEGRGGGSATARSSSADGSFRYGDTITVTATPDAGYRFVGWDGSTMTVNPLTETCSENASYVALFERVEFTVMVTAETGGTVLGDGSGTYQLGDDLSLLAEPETGFRFAGWSDGTTEPDRRVVVREDVSIAARFVPIEYEVLLTCDDGGTITYVSDGDPERIRYGDRLTVSAHPSAGYTFVGYTGDRVASDRTLAFQVTGNMAIHAAFTRDVATLTLVANEGGSVTLTDEGGTDRNGQAVAAGTRLTCVATAAPGWRFGGWENLPNPSQNPQMVTVTETFAAEASFVALGYAVFADARPGGSASAHSSSADGSFRYGDTITVTATPNTGHRFVGWQGLSSTDNPLVSVCTGDTLYVAAFERIEVAVTVDAGIGGAVAGATSGNYLWGDEIAAVAIADVGYTFVGWSGDLASSEHTITAMVGPVTLLHAQFVRNEWAILVYMAADNDLEPHAIDDLNEIERGFVDGGPVRVGVLLDRTPGYDSRWGDWTDARLFEVRHGATSECESIRVSSTELGLSVDAASELNMASGATLASVVATIRARWAPQRIAVVLWGHGSSWRGIEPDAGGGEPIAGALPRTTRGVGTDVSDGDDHLTLREIREAFAGLPVDTVVVDACFVASIETAAELASVAHYVVASPGEVPADGFDYEHLIGLLPARASSPTAVVDSAFDAFELRNAGSPDSVLTAWKGDALPQFATAFGDLIDVASEVMGADAVREAARSTLFLDTPAYYQAPGDLNVDVGSLIAYCATHLDAEDEAAAASSELASLITRSFRGSPATRQEAGISVHLVPIDTWGYPQRHADAYAASAPVGERLILSGLVPWAPDFVNENGFLYRLWYEELP